MQAPSCGPQKLVQTHGFRPHQATGHRGEDQIGRRVVEEAREAPCHPKELPRVLQAEFASPGLMASAGIIVARIPAKITATSTMGEMGSLSLCMAPRQDGKVDERDLQGRPPL
jgi:hypothetical protein